jgi:tRNA modification GTPase
MLTDVIAALSTPPGLGAVALVRVSGAGAFEVARRVIPEFRAEPYRSARLSRVVYPTTSDVLDEALYLTFRGPASYTGEDVVEVSTHGGLLVPAEVLGAFLAASARLAAPGEFTRRAVLNGRLDLLQAEAIADLVDATAPAQRRAAFAQFDRGLSGRLMALRDQVLEVEALCSYEIDFPEEDDGPLNAGRIDTAAARAEADIHALLGTAAEGERLRAGAVAVIAGRPNTGKSSLFNALLGTDRAIVTEIPGTTRDAIEAPATCGGFPFRLVDTAGLRESADVVERLGVEVSRRYLEGADVVLFCVEAGRAATGEERAFVEHSPAPTVIVRTKSDLAASGEDADTRLVEEITVSALTGEGLVALRSRLAGVAFSTLSVTGATATVLTRERHRAALTEARAEMRAFREARGLGIEAAVAAVHLRAATAALEDVVGVVTPEDVLDRVFATFCVGK